MQGPKPRGYIIHQKSGDVYFFFRETIRTKQSMPEVIEAAQRFQAEAEQLAVALSAALNLEIKWTPRIGGYMTGLAMEAGFRTTIESDILPRRLKYITDGLIAAGFTWGIW